MFKHLLMKPAGEEDSLTNEVETIPELHHMSEPPSDYDVDHNIPGEDTAPAGDKKVADPVKDQSKPAGYDAEPTEEPTKKVDPPKEKPTGYETEPTEEPTKKDETKKDETKPAEGEVQFSTEGLTDGDATRVKEFAKTHKLSKEQAEAMVAWEKNAVTGLADIEKKRFDEIKAETAKIRKGWYNELKNDTEFGGTKFDQSLHNVEQVLREHFPGLKKDLTDNGRMLPPVVMRELAKLHGVLYGTGKFVTGDMTGKSGNDENAFLGEYTT